MKKTLFNILFLTLLVGCTSSGKMNYSEQINKQIEIGNFTVASHIIDSIINDDGAISNDEINYYKFVKDSLNRVSLDFNQSIDNVKDWIEKHHGFTLTDEQIDKWENDLSLEYKFINGEKRYFRNAAPNLFRVSAEARELSNGDSPRSDLPRDELLVDAFNNKTAVNYVGHYLLPPEQFRIRYTITVKPDVVKDGELVRAWLPFPRSDMSRQYDVALVDASHENYILSENKTEHNSIYMKQVAVAGEKTVFWVEYDFVSQGEWYDLPLANVESYNTNTEEYKKYTSEKFPHIVFTDKLKQITDSVVGDVTNPVDILKRCYRYVASEYPWASAIEYSTIPNITEYAIINKKGDCGQVALLLLSMLRYKGIPAHWQSGWMLHPGSVNLHDWAEVYFEGLGWVPVDISFGRGVDISIDPGREFFMSGIDSYRLYINSDFSGDFYPLKIYPRSETVDFQRGEVESDNNNLYFDKWSYRLEIL